MNSVKIFLCLLLLSSGLPLWAQNSAAESTSSNWALGVGLGGRVNFMKITDIVSDFESNKQSRTGAMFSIFAYKDTDDGLLAIRPQLSFLSRGAKYTGLKSSTWTDAEYCVKAKYMDIRLPFILNFGTYRPGTVQPYIYLSPIVGMATGGEISMTESKSKGKSVAADVSKSNLSSLYLGAGAAFGLKYNALVNQKRFYLGLEMMYDCGLTNTYGQKEKEGKANDLAHLVKSTNNKLDGKRKFSGLEFQFLVGIPLGSNKSKPLPPEPTPIMEVPVVEIDTPIQDNIDIVEEPEKPCFQLEEIKTMMDNGENVIGKKICAVENVIQFAFGSAAINPESYPYLNELSKILKNTGANIKINGHTDIMGTDEYNMQLSADRAKSVLDYLVGQGMSPEKLSFEGYGFHRPISTNETEEGRFLNRRVEFEILGDTDNN